MTPADWFSISLALWAIRYGAKPALLALRSAIDLLLSDSEKPAPTSPK